MKLTHRLLPLLLFLFATSTMAQVSEHLRHFALEALKEKVREGGDQPVVQAPAQKRMNTETGEGAEPFISQSKFDPDLLSISYMDNQTFTWKISISEDGGASWTATNFNSRNLLNSVYPGQIIRGGGDPIGVFDSNGKLHVLFIHLHVSAANQNNQNAFIFELFYTTSDDKGQTWVMHNSIANGTFGSLDFVDRAWIDIDLQDNLYIAGVHFANSSIGDVGTIMWKKEATQSDFTPLGITAIPAVVNAPQFANLTMDANGVVHISASQISGTGNTPNDQVIYVRSNVGATSFGLPFSVATANTFPSNKVVHDRENGAISSAVDGDNVYLAWTDFEGSIKSYYVYSNDGGASFSSPVEIGVDFFGPDYYALMPVVAADDGHMAISWYKVDKTTQETEYVVANSNDFGSTLENVYSISDQLTDFSSTGTTFYGDYNSSTMKGDKVHMTWCDGRTGSPRVYYACIDFSQAVSTPEVSPINGGLELASIYPNPALENVSIALESQKAQMLRVEVLHISGKSCFQQTFSGKQGSNTFQLALDELPAGTYTVRVVSTDNYTVTRRLIKL